MSISSVAPSTQPAPVQASTPKAPDVPAGSDADTHQPTPKPPLPPGQGTRVDQLV
ncbi:hypothetical protein [Bradyrhizobium sp. NP1]|uniref:hypothetical protein n=1 Tax=Bradyrhizobium sp. NP1 TaxID=3049772 RepID=UPI0025A600DD|nr:hypothetical protein [Bradyrhizobium sp. NP1]WJR76184.1 hypothetical protein QOU61_25930 [Bradyrhizobium sp. NP1]